MTTTTLPCLLVLVVSRPARSTPPCYTHFFPPPVFPFPIPFPRMDAEIEGGQQGFSLGWRIFRGSIAAKG